jgi:predicted kinase
MNKKILIILCGEAFSGKSTLSKTLTDKYGAKIVGIDEVYFATENILALESTPDEDDASLWKNLWAVVFQGVKNHLLLGNSVIVDDNCFRLSRRDQLRSLAQETNAKSILVYADTPPEVLKERKGSINN